MGIRGHSFRVVGTVLALMCAALVFQNCGGKGLAQLDLADFKLDVSGSTQGNGSGYDGKLYVHVATNACADTLGFDRAIAGRNGKFYLTRDNCLDIATTEQPEVQVDTNAANPTRIYYQGQIFVEHLDLIGALEVSGSGFVSSGSLWKIANGQLRSEGKYVGRYDAEGRPLWSRRYQFEAHDLYQLGYSYMRPSRDGGMILSGGYGDGRYPASAEHATTWLARLDVDGNIVWNKRIDQANSKAIRFRGLTVDASDNTYALLAYEREGTTSAVIVAKFGPSGQILFSRTIPGDARSIHISPSGGLFVLTFVNGDANVLRFSSTGQSIYSRAYPGLATSALYGESRLFFANDDTVFVGGNKLVPAPEYPLHKLGHGRILELSANGDIKSALRFATEKPLSGPPLVTADGSFIFSESSMNALTFARYRRDFSQEWVLRKDETDGYRAPSIGRLMDGRFMFLQRKSSSLSMYSADLLSPLDIKRPELSCPQCVTGTMPDFIPATDMDAATEGAELGAHTGLTATDFPAVRFEPIQHYLPFELNLQ